MIEISDKYVNDWIGSLSANYADCSKHEKIIIEYLHLIDYRPTPKSETLGDTELLFTSICHFCLMVVIRCLRI